MPDNSDYSVRNKPHIAINAFRDTAKYKVPSRDRKDRPLREDYAAHAALLNSQLAAIFAASQSNALPRLQIGDLKPGTLVDVATKPPDPTGRTKASKIPATLEFPTQDILVLRSERTEDRTEHAVLFVPDEARRFLQDCVVDYGRDPGNERRAHLERFEIVETLRAAPAEELFIGPVDFDSPEPVWWELWVPWPAARVGNLAALARDAGFDVHPDQLVFPDTTVVFVHGVAAMILTFASRAPGTFSEIRRATGTIEPFLERGEGVVGQQDFVVELTGRIRPPPVDAPSVCVLDTGVSAGHPLLTPGLTGVWAYNAAWGADDHHPHGGHGTGLAALALYGDLESLMAGAAPVALTHGVESMKLLQPPGFPETPPPSWGIVTQGAVALVEIERPTTLRSLCIASSARFFPSSRPSSWSGALDQITSGAMPGEGDGVPNATDRAKRLVLVATGNVRGGQREDVEPLQTLEDPAQSWNALTIGGFTRKDQPPAAPPVLTPVVTANNRSPFSLGSHLLPDDLTPIKPEVLFEAGNMLADASDFCGWHESVSLLTAGSDVAAEPLMPIWATSAAAGVAGNFAGRLQAARPDLWPETHRALIVDSATWPQPIRARLIGRGAHWKTSSAGQRQQVLREVGYGVPDIDRAIRSASNDMTLVEQAEIQPFVASSDGRSAVFNEMHFYRLPWPRAALERLENAIVAMKVTLSYFIEPNLTGKAATRPTSYRSFGLRFDMKKRTESDAAFRARVSASQAKDGSASAKEASHWLLGPKSIQAGSLHCDVWRGYAADLAGHDGIAVYPVTGWWKSHTGQRRVNAKARYALTISIAAPGQAIDLHAEVTALVEAAQVSVDAT